MTSRLINWKLDAAEKLEAAGREDSEGDTKGRGVRAKISGREVQTTTENLLLLMPQQSTQNIKKKTYTLATSGHSHAFH